MGALSTSKRAWLATWNGPFYIGPLARPASTGDVLLKLLETLWRGGIILAVAILLVAAITATIAVYDDIRGPFAPTPLIEQVDVQASVDPEFCADAGYPLHVAVFNHSQQRIGSVTFEVRAYEEGRSTNLVDWLGVAPYSDDAIIMPGEGQANCWQLPALSQPQRDSAKITYEAILTSVEATKRGAAR